MLDANIYLNKMLAERYRIVREIGRGASSLVFYAEDMMTKQENGTPMPVALKILDKDSNEYKLNSRSFRTETRAVVDMPTNPHIVAVQDVSYDYVTGVHFIVMEYVKGTTLRRYMSSHTFSARELVSIALQVLHALRNAHEAGVVHRDVKPQNILVQNAEDAGSAGVQLPGGKGMPYIKLADFGIALLPDEDLFAMTDRGVGTVHYISPEQAGGGTIDARSDIYSLGVVLYEMATGRVPFDAESATAVITKHQTHAPMHARMFNPNLPLSLDHIIFTAMQKDPRHRFKDAAAMEKKLYEVLRELDGLGQAIPEISTLPRKEVVMPTRVPKAPKVPKEPKVPKAPKEPKPEKMPKAPKEPKLPKEPKPPKEPKVPREKTPHRGIPKPVLIAGASVLGAAVLAALVIGAVFFFKNVVVKEKPVMITIPNFVESYYDQNASYQEGIKVEAMYENHPTIPKGQIISQSEGAGKEVMGPITIYVTVSLGPVTIPFNLPEAYRESFYKAKEYLEEKYHYQISVNARFDKAAYDPSLGASGTVIGATFLADGAELPLTDGAVPENSKTTITLRVNGDREVAFSLPVESCAKPMDAMNYILNTYGRDVSYTVKNEIAGVDHPDATLNAIYSVILPDGSVYTPGDDPVMLIINTPTSVTLICNAPPKE